MTVIAPWWQAQAWFQKLVKLSVTPPVTLPSNPRMMILREARPEPLKNHHWKIYAWRIYGSLASEGVTG